MPRRSRTITLARRVLAIEARAVRDLVPRIGPAFERAVDLVCQCSGRVVITGIGKSGIVARKLAGTLSSTGTPAVFLHAGDAGHGDLGLLQSDDVLIAVSYSGETGEVLMVGSAALTRGVHVVAISGNCSSRLARLAEAVIDAHVTSEACPLDAVPTASSTASLAMSDALAMAVADRRGFNRRALAAAHPSGAIGARLACPSDTM